MAKRIMEVTLAVPRKDGLAQTHVEANYGYFYDDRHEIHTIQGNVVSIPMHPIIQAYMDHIENAIVVDLETPPQAVKNALEVEAAESLKEEG